MAIVSGALQPGCLGPVPTPPCMQALRTIYLSQNRQIDRNSLSD